MTTKICFKCNKEQDIDEFYKHPKTADRHLGKCKTCTKKDVSKNYQDKRQQYALYEQERYQQPKRRVFCLDNQRKRRKNHPEKYKTATAVSNAIRNGKLIKQPCEKCGDIKVQAHHEDYSKPLDVAWLCRKCHLSLHGKKAYIF